MLIYKGKYVKFVSLVFPFKQQVFNAAKFLNAAMKENKTPDFLSISAKINAMNSNLSAIC